MAVELIGQILLRRTSLTEQQLADVLAAQRAGGGVERIGRMLASQGLLTGQEVLEALAEQLAMGSWRVSLQPRAREEISQSLQERFPKGYEKLLRAYFQNLAQSEER